MNVFLHIQGVLSIPKDPQLVNELAQAGAARWFRMETQNLDGTPGLVLKPLENILTPGEENELLDFLKELGEKFPGKITGEFEVWWPMAVESGPQWWELAEDGTLFVQESDIVRGEKKKYKEK